MKIDFNKHSDSDIMEELIRAKLFTDASNLIEKHKAQTMMLDIGYQKELIKAYSVVLDYITNSGDKRLKMFDKKF
jgi:hypothetical protein